VEGGGRSLLAGPVTVQGGSVPARCPRGPTVLPPSLGNEGETWRQPQLPTSDRGWGLQQADLKA
jgi:hypothetical protein